MLKYKLEICTYHRIKNNFYLLLLGALDELYGGGRGVEAGGRGRVVGRLAHRHKAGAGAVSGKLNTGILPVPKMKYFAYIMYNTELLFLHLIGLKLLNELYVLTNNFPIVVTFCLPYIT